MMKNTTAWTYNHLDLNGSLQDDVSKENTTPERRRRPSGDRNWIFIQRTSMGGREAFHNASSEEVGTQRCRRCEHWKRMPSKAFTRSFKAPNLSTIASLRRPPRPTSPAQCQEPHLRPALPCAVAPSTVEAVIDAQPCAPPKWRSSSARDKCCIPRQGGCCCRCVGLAPEPKSCRRCTPQALALPTADVAAHHKLQPCQGRC
jgi:hypothetical protein